MIQKMIHTNLDFTLISNSLERPLNYQQHHLKYVMDLQVSDTEVNKEQFEKELRRYYEEEIFSEELGEIILRLIAGQLYSHKWVGYSGIYREMMYGKAMDNCMNAVLNKSYDLEKNTSVFGYYYRVVQNSFIGALAKLRKQSNKMDEYRELTITKYCRDNPDYYYMKPEHEDFESFIEETEE